MGNEVKNKYSESNHLQTMKEEFSFIKGKIDDLSSFVNNTISNILTLLNISFNAFLFFIKKHPLYSFRHKFLFQLNFMLIII